MAFPSAAMVTPSTEMWSPPASNGGAVRATIAINAAGDTGVGNPGRATGKANVTSKTWLAIKDRAAKKTASGDGAFMPVHRSTTKDHVPPSACSVSGGGRRSQTKWSLRWPSLQLDAVEIQVYQKFQSWP